jgi:glutamate synthase (NADPH/NADH) large chain
VPFPSQGLYDPANEHDACGVGFIAHIKGKKSHEIVEQGLQILKNLDHRGAVGADPLMGDGAGILIQIPDAFFREEMAKQGVTLPPPASTASAWSSCRRSTPRASPARRRSSARARRGPGVLGWRDVPVDHHADVARPCGQGAGDPPGLHRPRPDVMVTDALERKLYVIRRRAANAIGQLNLKHGKEFYVPSMSARTIVYKGLLLADQVGEYYLDLQDPRCVSALALVHQRFSTNTFPTWHLAHPFR